MSWTGTARWIAPPPTILRTIARRRLWRWTEHDSALLHVDDTSRLRGPDDPCRHAPGFDQPGIAVFDADHRPVLALGRHPRLHADDSTLDDALLLPTEAASWERCAVATTTAEAQVIRDLAGVERARRTWHTNWRALPVDTHDRIVVGATAWRIEDVTSGRGGLLGLFTTKRLVGLRLLAGDAVEAEATCVDARPWDGDITVPLNLRWNTPPDRWRLAAFALLVLEVIDARDPGHSE